MSASLHSTNSMRRTILAILIVLGVIVIDQLIKFDIKTTFMLHEDYVVARDWFHILFTENRGMAFGMQFVGHHVLGAFPRGSNRPVLRAAFAVNTAQGSLWSDSVCGHDNSRCCGQHHRQHVLWSDIHRKHPLFTRPVSALWPGLWQFLVGQGGRYVLLPVVHMARLGALVRWQHLLWRHIQFCRCLNQLWRRSTRVVLSQVYIKHGAA